MVLPSWMDSRRMLGLFDYAARPVAVGAGVVQPVAPNDPDRWAIGFSGPAITDIVVGPMPDPTSLGFSFGSTRRADQLWFSLFEFGPLVSYQWFALSAFPVTLSVHTITYRG